MHLTSLTRNTFTALRKEDYFLPRRNPHPSIRQVSLLPNHSTATSPPPPSKPCSSQAIFLRASARLSSVGRICSQLVDGLLHTLDACGHLQRTRAHRRSHARKRMSWHTHTRAHAPAHARTHACMHARTRTHARPHVYVRVRCERGVPLRANESKGLPRSRTPAARMHARACTGACVQMIYVVRLPGAYSHLRARGCRCAYACDRARVCVCARAHACVRLSTCVCVHACLSCSRVSASASPDCSSFDRVVFDAACVGHKTHLQRLRKRRMTHRMHASAISIWRTHTSRLLRHARSSRHHVCAKRRKGIKACFRLRQKRARSEPYLGQVPATSAPGRS
eukprot:6204767-Pleurochrysis_carterae.AAC.1